MPDEVRGVVLGSDEGAGRSEIVEGECGTARDVLTDGGIAEDGGEKLLVC